MFSCVFGREHLETFPINEKVIKYSYSCHGELVTSNTKYSETAAVSYWLERPPRERGIVDSIPGHNRSKSLKLVLVAFPNGAQDHGNSATNVPPVSGKWTG